MNNPTLKAPPIAIRTIPKTFSLFLRVFPALCAEFSDGWLLFSLFCVFLSIAYQERSEQKPIILWETSLCDTRCWHVGETGVVPCVKNINATSQAQASCTCKFSLHYTTEHSTGMDRSRSNMFECDNKSLCFVKWTLLLSNILVWVS